MARRLWIKLLSAITIAAFLSAPVSDARAGSEVIETAAAVSFVEQVGADILGQLKSGNSAEQKNAYFTGLMLDYVDFRTLGTRVLGRMARKSTPEQRAEFYPLFACFFIDKVLTMIDGLELEGYQVGRAQTMPDNEVIVAVKVEKSDGTKLSTGWRLTRADGALSVVDINVEGASAVGHFRDQMSRGTSTNITGNIQKLKQLIGANPIMDLVRARMRDS